MHEFNVPFIIVFQNMVKSLKAMPLNFLLSNVYVPVDVYTIQTKMYSL